MLFKRFTNKSICLDHAPLVDVGSMRVGRLRPLPARATFTLSSIIYVAKRAHSTKDRKETIKPTRKRLMRKRSPHLFDGESLYMTMIFISDTDFVCILRDTCVRLGCAIGVDIDIEF